MRLIASTYAPSAVYDAYFHPTSRWRASVCEKRTTISISAILITSGNHRVPAAVPASAAGCRPSEGLQSRRCGQLRSPRPAAPGHTTHGGLTGNAAGSGIHPLPYPPRHRCESTPSDNIPRTRRAEQSRAEPGGRACS